MDPTTRYLRSPGTHARNQLYTEHAKRMFVTAARAALDAAAQRDGRSADEEAAR